MVKVKKECYQLAVKNVKQCYFNTKQSEWKTGYIKYLVNYTDCSCLHSISGFSSHNK